MRMMSACFNAGAAGPGCASGDRDRAVGVQQHQRHRLAEDRAASHHHGMAPGERDTVGLEQAHDPGRGGRSPRMLAHRHAAEAETGHAVHVLRQIDRVEAGTLVDLRRHRVLQQDAVAARVGVQLRRSSPATVPWRRSPASRRPSTHADALAGILLHAHVGRGRRVVAHQGWSPGSALPAAARADHGDARAQFGFGLLAGLSPRTIAGIVPRRSRRWVKKGRAFSHRLAAGPSKRAKFDAMPRLTLTGSPLTFALPCRGPRLAIWHSAYCMCLLWRRTSANPSPLPRTICRFLCPSLMVAVQSVGTGLLFGCCGSIPVGHPIHLPAFFKRSPQMAARTALPCALVCVHDAPGYCGNELTPGKGVAPAVVGFQGTTWRRRRGRTWPARMRAQHGLFRCRGGSDSIGLVTVAGSARPWAARPVRYGAGAGAPCGKVAGSAPSAPSSAPASPVPVGGWLRESWHGRRTPASWWPVST